MVCVCVCACACVSMCVCTCVRVRACCACMSVYVLMCTREVHELAVSVHKVVIFSRVPVTPDILDRNRQFVDLPRVCVSVSHCLRVSV